MEKKSTRKVEVLLLCDAFPVHQNIARLVESSDISEDDLTSFYENLFAENMIQPRTRELVNANLSYYFGVDPSTIKFTVIDPGYVCKSPTCIKHGIWGFPFGGASMAKAIKEFSLSNKFDFVIDVGCITHTDAKCDAVPAITKDPDYFFGDGREGLPQVYDLLTTKNGYGKYLALRERAIPVSRGLDSLGSYCEGDDAIGDVCETPKIQDKFSVMNTGFKVGKRHDPACWLSKKE